MSVAINFSMIPSDELLTLALSIIKFFEGADLSGTGLDVFIANIKKTVTEFESALERESKNPYTDLLVKADDARDESFIAFRDYAEACLHRKKEGWKVAAVYIISVIRKHGWGAANFGYKAETAALTHISSEIRSKYLAQLNLIAGAEWLDEMDADQLAFEELVKESITSGYGDSPTVRKTRPALVDAIRSLLSFLPLQYKVTDSIALSGYITCINELILDTMITVRTNATRAENKKNKDKNVK